jgi:hypothetical protein
MGVSRVHMLSSGAIPNDELIAPSSMATDDALDRTPICAGYTLVVTWSQSICLRLLAM